MMRPPACVHLTLSMTAAVMLLTACTPAPQASVADRAALQACRQRAESIDLQQNRTNLYRTDTMNAPYASTGLPTDTTIGLSERYSYDNVVDNCLRGSEANTEIGSGPAVAVAPRPNTARPPGAAPLAGPAPGAPLSAPP